MARIKKPHGCYYKAVNVLFSWDNTVYLANDLRAITKSISYSYDGHYEGDDGEKYGDKYEYQKADCCPFACPVNKPKWHIDESLKHPEDEVEEFVSDIKQLYPNHEWE